MINHIDTQKDQTEHVLGEDEALKWRALVPPSLFLRCCGFATDRVFVLLVMNGCDNSTSRPIA